MSDEPAETKPLETRVGHVRDELKHRLKQAHDKDRWDKLVSIGPYALPVVVAMSRDMTPRERAAFFNFLLEHAASATIDPEQTRIFNELSK